MGITSRAVYSKLKKYEINLRISVALIKKIMQWIKTLLHFLDYMPKAAPVSFTQVSPALI